MFEFFLTQEIITTQKEDTHTVLVNQKKKNGKKLSQHDWEYNFPPTDI